VRFHGQSQRLVESFDRELMQLPEVLSPAHVTGDDDGQASTGATAPFRADRAQHRLPVLA